MFQVTSHLAIVPLYVLTSREMGYNSVTSNVRLQPTGSQVHYDIPLQLGAYGNITWPSIIPLKTSLLSIWQRHSFPGVGEVRIEKACNRSPTRSWQKLWNGAKTLQKHYDLHVYLASSLLLVATFFSVQTVPLLHACKMIRLRDTLSIITHNQGSWKVVAAYSNTR